MPDASPAKWHQAHTTWFFETLVLAAALPGYRPFDPRFALPVQLLLRGAGPAPPAPAARPAQPPQPGRGAGLARQHVDAALQRFMPSADADALALITLGIQHEQQHQELMLTDLLHAFSGNPLLPAYRSDAPAQHRASTLEWLAHPGGITEVGHRRPRFRLRQRVPTPPDAAACLPDCPPPGELRRVRRLHRRRRLPAPRRCGCRMAGRRCSRRAGSTRPTGRRHDQAWQVFGLHGLQPMDPAAPVMQLSFFEAAAFAEWAGARLPTEFEWEAAAGPAGHQPACRPGLAMDPLRLPPLPGLQADGRRRGRIQRQIHGAASWCCAAAAWPRPPATHGRATATSSRRPPAGSSAACALQEMESPHHEPASHCQADVCRRPACRAEPAAARHFAQVFLRRDRLPAVRADLRAARVLPDPHRAGASAKARCRDGRLHRARRPS